jgi:hypothetical protein
MQLSNTLIDLLDEGAGFDAEYDGGLSNHRPMALVAMARLGASPEQLQAFAKHYSARLLAAPARQEWSAGQPWKEDLGQRAAWPLYRDLFMQWLRSEYAGEVLRQALPTLMQGCGAAAFHGLIRTAYALQAAHRQELADALAYWACRWLDLGEAAAPGQQTDPEVLLRRLRVVPSGADLIFQRMHAAAAVPHFQASVAQLQVNEQTLPRLAVLAAQAYAASGNFTALHLVTSAHAVRVLAAELEPDVAAAVLHPYWRAYAAAVSVAGLQVAPPVELLPWPRIVALALSSLDDHVIKLVDSCREQQRVLGGDVWQAAASRAVAS